MKVVSINTPFNAAHQRQQQDDRKPPKPSKRTIELCAGAWHDLTIEEKMTWVLSKTPSLSATPQYPRAIAYTTVASYLENDRTYLPMVRGEIISKPFAKRELAKQAGLKEAEYVAKQYRARGINMNVKELDVYI